MKNRCEQAVSQGFGRGIRLLLPIALLSILGGCAVIDTSVMDSAIPLMGGEVKAMTYFISGIEQNSLVYTAEFPEDDDNDRIANAKADLGLKVGIGIGNNMELDISTLAFSAPLGKAALKIGIMDDGTNAVAIMPGVYSYKGTGPHEFNPGGSDQRFEGEYESAGLELPILYTHREGKAGKISICGKIGYNSLDYKRIDHYYPVTYTGEYETLYGALVINPQLKIWKIVLSPEGGIHGIKTDSGKFTLVPTLNLGIGIELGK